MSIYRDRTAVRCWFGALLLAAAAWCADSATAWAMGWRPQGIIEHLGLALGSVAVLAVLAALAEPHARAAMRRRAPDGLLFLGVSAILIVMLEVTAAWLEPALRPGAPFHTRGVLRQEIFYPDPVALPGIEGATRYTTLDSGVRAMRPPAADDFQLLCLGGSTTECVYLDDSETWPALLERALRSGPGRPVWVGNVGISGFDTREHLRFLRESRLLRGVTAVVVQPGVNDLWRYLAGEDDAIDYARFASPSDAPPPNPDRDARTGWRPLWTRARLIQLWHTWRQPPPAPERREGIGGGEYTLRRERRAAAVRTTALPPLAQGLAQYRERITALIAAGRARGVTLVFSTQPVLWDAALPPDVAARCWFGWLPDGRYLTLDTLRTAMDAYNTALQDVCAAQQVACVDLGAMNGNPAYFYDDCHFTEAGARAVAEALAPAVRQVLSR
jgi:lysophospholipase L1-like esterase